MNVRQLKYLLSVMPDDADVSLDGEFIEVDAKDSRMATINVSTEGFGELYLGTVTGKRIRGMASMFPRGAAKKMLKLRSEVR